MVPWSHQSGTALLVVGDAHQEVTTQDVTTALAAAARTGFRQVVTTALDDHSAEPFVAAGFRQRERLVLLRHRLQRVPPRPIAPRPRPAEPADWPAMAVLDRAGFEPGWQLDEEGLRAAAAATPASQVRVISGDASPSQPTGSLLGYAITGRGGAHGYLQRLAVDPAQRGRGLARSLVLDSLHWLVADRAEHAFVNTQVHNHAARRLYEGLGFEDLGQPLTVWERSLGGPSR